MGFLRGIFLFALVMLGIGIVGTHFLLANLFSQPPGAPARNLALAVHRPSGKPHHASPAKKTHRHTVRTHDASATVTVHTPTRTATPSPTAIATFHVVMPHHATHHRHQHGIVRRSVARQAKPTATPTVMPTATPLPSPTPTATTGTVTLANYWVGSTTVAPGQTISIGYVINNGTGRTVRITLGASIKSSRVTSWLSGQINDPYHDVVAIVPPGISTHIRYFTVPARLHAGRYDVAWGLSNAANGSRDALVSATAALRVHG